MVRENLNLRNTVIVLALTGLAAFVFGCAAITVPSPEEIVTHPLGTESIKIGMTKKQVESIWGKPSNIRLVENKEKWKDSREVWTYNAQYGAIPVDAGYLSKTKKLYFDGNNLTDIE
jgi:hypothetical protein